MRDQRFNNRRAGPPPRRYYQENRDNHSRDRDVDHSRGYSPSRGRGYRPHNWRGRPGRGYHHHNYRGSSNFRPAPIPANDNDIELSKRCTNCYYFSCDLKNCSKCGQPLRENARVFRNPYKVRDELLELIQIVQNNEFGPDFQPLKPATGEIAKSILRSTSLNNAIALNLRREKKSRSSDTNAGDGDSPHSSSENVPPRATAADRRLEPPEDRAATGPSRSAPIPEVVTEPKVEYDANSALRRENSKKRKNKKIVYISDDDEDNEDQHQNFQELAEPNEKNLAEENESNEQAETTTTISIAKNLFAIESDSDENNTSTEIDDTLNISAEPQSTLNATSSSEPGPSASQSQTVRLCHNCDSYSFNLKRCTNCKSVFKEKNPKVHAPLELSSLTKSELKSVHRANEEKNSGKKNNDSVNTNQGASNSDEVVAASTTKKKSKKSAAGKDDSSNVSEISDIIPSTSASDPDETEVPAGESNNSNPMPAAARQPAAAILTERVEIPILDPNFDPSALAYVKLCPQCFDYRTELNKCGFCGKKFGKQLPPLLIFSNVNRKQLAENEAKHKEYAERMYQLEQEKIREQVRKFEEKLLRKVNEKFGLVYSSELANDSSFNTTSSDQQQQGNTSTSNSSATDNNRERKRKEPPSAEITTNKTNNRDQENVAAAGSNSAGSKKVRLDHHDKDKDIKQDS